MSNDPRSINPFELIPGGTPIHQPWVWNTAFEAPPAEDKLPEVQRKPSIVQDLGLPPKARRTLMSAAQRGDLEALKAAPPPPEGYIRHRCKTTGLYFLTPVAGGTGCFDWRDVIPAYHLTSDMPELPPPKLEREEIQEAHQQPYLVTLDPGVFWCRLCQETALEDHAESTRHCSLKALWQRCVDLARSMCQEVPSTVDHDSAVLFAWRAEFLLELLDVHDTSDTSDPKDVQQVLALFGRLVEQRWPSRWCDLPAKLEQLVSVAEQPEPELVQLPALPEFGVDLLCFPSITRPLSEKSTNKDLSNFNMLDFLTHGLELQDSGILRCWYCETEVSLEQLPQHILPYHRDGKFHDWKRFEWNANAAYIKEHGWGLPCKVRGKSIVCQCNPNSEVSGLLEDRGVGFKCQFFHFFRACRWKDTRSQRNFSTCDDVWWLEDHVGTKRHKSFAPNPPKPSWHVEQRRRAKWIAAMDIAEAKQMELLRQRQESRAQKLNLNLVSESNEARGPNLHISDMIGIHQSLYYPRKKLAAILLWRLIERFKILSYWPHQHKQCLEAPTAADREKANAAAAGRGCPDILPPLCWGYKGKKDRGWVWLGSWLSLLSLVGIVASKDVSNVDCCTPPMLIATSMTKQVSPGKNTREHILYTCFSLVVEVL